MTSPLQRLQRTAHIPCQFGFHPDPDGNVRFRHALAVLTDRSKRHANNSVLLGNLCNDIDPMRICPVIEDDQNVVAIAELADSTDHSISPVLEDCSMKIVTVTSKAQHELEVELADLEGMRLAYVLSDGPGAWRLTFLPVSAFTDWSGQ
jgi:hypothetical protein